jgi:hypothetical protein
MRCLPDKGGIIMKKLFTGKKRLFTIPIAIIVGLAFLPVTFFFLIGWLIYKKVPNKKIKYTGISLAVLFAVFFGSAYAAAIVSPSPPKPVVSEQRNAPQTIPATETSPKIQSLTPTIIENTTTSTNISITQTNSNFTVKRDVKFTPTPTAYTVRSSTPTIGQVGSYVCNCAKTCTQMTSCSEAQYQLNVCGCSKRDADGDGIACDTQCQ